MITSESMDEWRRMNTNYLVIQRASFTHWDYLRFTHSLLPSSWSPAIAGKNTTFGCTIGPTIPTLSTTATRGRSQCGHQITNGTPNQTVQRTGASRFAQRQIERHRRLAPVADLCVRPHGPHRFKSHGTGRSTARSCCRPAGGCIDSEFAGASEM